MQESFLTSDWQWGDYRYFTIYEPKKRLITEAPFRERIMHHALMNVCDQYFEKKHYFHSYACRVGKGMHRAVKQCQKYTQKNQFYLKCDIRKFFDSIDHSVLMHLLSRLFKDPKLLL